MSRIGATPTGSNIIEDIRATNADIWDDDHAILVENIDIAHGMTHRGSHFSLYYFDADLDTSETLSFLVKTPTSTSCHLTYGIRASGAGTLSFCEGAMALAATSGATATSYNSKRTSTKSAATVIMTGTIAVTKSAATLSFEYLGANYGPQIRYGGAAAREDEWILNTGSTYSLQFNSDADNNKVSAYLLWYEAGVT